MMDIGNLHVIDYYLYHATTYDYNKPPWAKPIVPKSGWLAYQLEQASKRASYMPKWLTRQTEDFDISIEQREGWAYDD